MLESASKARAIGIGVVAVVFGACYEPWPSDGFEQSESQEIKNSLRVDAALKGAGAYAAYTYVFRGSKYRRVTNATGAFNDGGSLPVFAFHLPSDYHAGVDAALDGRGSFASKGYFFLGSNYARYDWAQNAIDFQGTLGGDWNLPAPFSNGIDAAVNGEGAFASKAFFFKGDQYVRYDWGSGQVDAGYPQPLAAWNLPAPFSSGIDTVVPLPGKLAFIRDDSLIYYNWSNGTVSTVQSVLTAWPALTALDDAPTRRIVLYVTIDPVADIANHAPNVAGLKQALLTHPPAPGYPAIYVDQWWGHDVTSGMLDDPHVMAVFASGSFTEWYTLHPQPIPVPGPGDYYWSYFNNGWHPSWREWVEAYANRLWESNVPFLAVCGSHQLMSGVRAGWSSVGHLGTNVTIANELADGISRIPDPRFYEWGAFPIVLDAPNDPLFAGIPNPAVFSLTHADEVRSGSFSPEATRIARRDPPPAGGPYTEVQALKYTIASRPDRIAYSTQFHPEHMLDPPNYGAKLIQNFADIALQYWETH